MARDWLTLADAVTIHMALIRRHGGASGLRDPGALESALFRPQTGYYDDIVAEAAALLESLAINHPFVDGNKRAAFAATDVFLRINGRRIEADPLRTHAEMMTMFDANAFNFEMLEPWLRGLVR